MRFNDFATLSEQEYKLMKQSYEDILTNEVNDLQEILSKMQKQKSNLENSNASKKYEKILQKLSNNIEELSSIISINSGHLKTSVIPQIKGLLVSQDNEIAISPIRSKWEIENHRENPQMSTPPVTTNTHKRNFPLQSNFLLNVFKKLSLKTKSINSDNYRNKYHNIFANSCDEYFSIENDQADIIRLLLLYMILRPNCKFISRIANITSDQFSIFTYLTLKEHK